MAVPYWRLSSFYLCYFATLGAFIPYWSLYLKESGFNAAEIGQLSALLVGTKVIAPNLWGWIADHSRKNLRIIRWTAFIASLLFAGFLAVYGYREYALLTIVFSFFWNAPLPLYEAVTLSHLQADSHGYSRIRLWGSVGFILTVAAVGKLLDSQPIALLPYLITGLLGLNWLTTLVTPKSRNVSHDHSQISVTNIIKKPEVIAFLLVYVLLQFAHAPYYVFHAVYLRGILLTSLVFAVVRWLLIGAYVDNLGLMVIAQLLHAATFGGTHIAAIHLVHRYFDQHHQSKGQALYHSLSFGLGGMIGSLLSGRYWETLGSHVVFTAAAIACGIAYIIAYIWVGRGNGLSLRESVA